MAEPGTSLLFCILRHIHQIQIKFQCIIFSQSCVKPCQGTTSPNLASPWVGRKLAGWAYTPCNPSAPYSMYCRAIQDSGAGPPDFCLPNGLCQNSENPIATFWIESCSDTVVTLRQNCHNRVAAHRVSLSWSYSHFDKLWPN